MEAADQLPKSSIDAGFYELEAGRHVSRDREGSHRLPRRIHHLASAQKINFYYQVSAVGTERRR